MKRFTSKISILSLIYVPATLCFTPLLQPAPVRASSEEPCRAAIVLDRSESVTEANLLTMKQQIARLFVGPSIDVDPVAGGLYTDKIHLGFWTFANLLPETNFNAPYHGFVSSRGTHTGFNNSLNSVTRVSGSLRGYTNYMHGMAHMSPAQINPHGTMRTVVDQTDVLVFLTDGVPNKPGDNNINAKASARNAGRDAALRQKAAGKILVGGFIKGRDSDYDTGRREVNYIINGSFTNTTDTFDIASNYSDMAQQLKTVIAEKCQFPTNPYELQPKVTLPGGKVYDPGSNVVVDPTVHNNGPSPSDDTEWRLTQVVLRPGDTSLDNKESGGDSAEEPCGSYWRPSDGSSCSTIDQGTDRFTRINVDTSLRSAEVRLDELPAGTRYCFGLSVQPPSNSSDAQNTWRHSALECVKIGKRPKLQVRGGDLLVDGNIHTGRSYTNFLPSRQPNGTYAEQRTYGSWAEYGVLASGAVDRLGSGGIFRTGLVDTRKELGYLTFTNTRDSTDTPHYGHYTDNIDSGMARVTQFFAHTSDLRTETTGSSHIDLSTLESGTYLLPNGPVRITVETPNHTLPTSRSIVLLAQHRTSILIDSDIATPSVYESIADISQVVIAPRHASIGYHIGIAPQTSRVDAWLLNPRGTLNTCDLNIPSHDARNQPRLYAECDEELTINGPVAIQSLYLRRLGGADQDSTRLTQSRGAETFNLRPDAYLWASARYGAGTKVYITTNRLDLPPRY